MIPTVNSKDISVLEARFPGEIAEPRRSPAELFEWLESAKPAWRSASRFDRPKERLGDSMEGSIDHGRLEPIVSAMIFLQHARRYRDLRKRHLARQSIARAYESVLKIRASHPARASLEASCHLQKAWLEYCWEDYELAELGVFNALKALGGRDLRVLGQILSLRSIIKRTRRQYHEALEDLRMASECWLAEADLYNLFSVYHNLGALVEQQAEDEQDQVQRIQLLGQAIEYYRKSCVYCFDNGVGQNTIVTRMKLASLYGRVGNFKDAMEQSDVGYKEAFKKENWAEAAWAHSHVIRLLLWKEMYPDAEARQMEFMNNVSSSEILSAVDDLYTEMLRQVRRSPGCLPSVPLRWPGVEL
jgi:tetratricopeptide (TPR) repeat protein